MRCQLERASEELGKPHRPALQGLRLPQPLGLSPLPAPDASHQPTFQGSRKLRPLHDAPPQLPGQRQRPLPVADFGKQQAFLGPTFRLIRSRGQFLETPWTSFWLATYHPSALLRIPDAAARAEAKAHFKADLAKVAAALREGSLRTPARSLDPGLTP